LYRYFSNLFYIGKIVLSVRKSCAEKKNNGNNLKYTNTLISKITTLCLLSIDIFVDSSSRTKEKCSAKTRVTFIAYSSWLEVTSIAKSYYSRSYLSVTSQ